MRSDPTAIRSRKKGIWRASSRAHRGGLGNARDSTAEGGRHPDERQSGLGQPICLCPNTGMIRPHEQVCHNPVGVDLFFRFLPRVAPLSQPWARWRNLFEVEGGRAGAWEKAGAGVLAEAPAACRASLGSFAGQERRDSKPGRRRFLRAKAEGMFLAVNNWPPPRWVDVAPTPTAASNPGTKKGRPGVRPAFVEGSTAKACPDYGKTCSR